MWAAGGRRQGGGRGGSQELFDIAVISMDTRRNTHTLISLCRSNLVSAQRKRNRKCVCIWVTCSSETLMMALRSKEPILSIYRYLFPAFCLYFTWWISVGDSEFEGLVKRFQLVTFSTRLSCSNQINLNCCTFSIYTNDENIINKMNQLFSTISFCMLLADNHTL